MDLVLGPLGCEIHLSEFAFIAILAACLVFTALLTANRGRKEKG